MFITCKSIENLDSFLSGFIFAGSVFTEIDNKTNVMSHKDTLYDFEAYICLNLEHLKKKYSPENLLREYNYYELLLLASNNDPEKAFDLFFELFDEYKKEKGIIYEWDKV